MVKFQLLHQEVIQPLHHKETKINGNIKRHVSPEKGQQIIDELRLMKYDNETK